MQFCEGFQNPEDFLDNAPSSGLFCVGHLFQHTYIIAMIHPIKNTEFLNRDLFGINSSLVSDVRLVERFGILHQSKTLMVIDFGSTFESKRLNGIFLLVQQVHVVIKTSGETNLDHH